MTETSGEADKLTVRVVLLGSEERPKMKTTRTMKGGARTWRKSTESPTSVHQCMVMLYCLAISALLTKNKDSRTTFNNLRFSYKDVALLGTS